MGCHREDVEYMKNWGRMALKSILEVFLDFLLTRLGAEKMTSDAKNAGKYVKTLKSTRKCLWGKDLIV